jgi:hypothetical protein
MPQINMTYIHFVFISMSVSFEVNGHQSMLVTFVVTVIKKLKSENVQGVPKRMGI